MKSFREFSKATPAFLFQESKLDINRVEARITDSFVTESDLDLSHLKPDQRTDLIKTIDDVGLTREPDLGKVTCIKHTTDVGFVRPIKQAPYRVTSFDKSMVITYSFGYTTRWICKILYRLSESQFGD